MNTKFKEDLKFTIKAIIVCLLMAYAVRGYIKIGKILFQNSNPTELKK